MRSMNLRELDIHALPDDPELLKSLLVELIAQQIYLMEQLNIAKAKQFAAKSEKSPDQLQFIFNEAETLKDLHDKIDVEATESDETSMVESSVESEVDTKPVKRRATKAIAEHIPRQEVILDLPEAQKVCPCCNGQLHKMGEERSEQLEFIPASVQVRVNVRPKYACRTCDHKGVDSGITIAPLPANPIPKSMATPSLLAHIIAAKYLLSLPLYRQAMDFQRQGIPLNRQTLANWMIQSFDFLEPYFQRLKWHLQQESILHADETVCQVLQEDKSQCYMWMYCSGKDSPVDNPPNSKNIVLYDYQSSRGADHPMVFLQNFKGYLQVDGYIAYEKLPQVTLVGCFAHARRKFIEAQQAQPKGKTGKADWAVQHIQKLYAVEKAIQSLSTDEKYRIRQEKSKPLLEAFKAWLETSLPRTLPSSAIGKAVQYCLNQWDKLVRYIDHGDLDIDNNRAERAAKSFVIGRKNWLFCNTISGAKASAGLYSLIETAKCNGLDPRKLLERLFNELQSCQNDADLDSLMPWNLAL
jgi:transposase